MLLINPTYFSINTSLLLEKIITRISSNKKAFYCILKCTFSSENKIFNKCLNLNETQEDKKSLT